MNSENNPIINIWPRKKEDFFLSEPSIEKYLSNDATNSNMVELIEALKKDQEIERICSENHLNKTLIGKVLFYFMHAFNNTETAQKLKIHRVTVQRYAAALKKLPNSDFDLLCEYALSMRRENNGK